MPNWCSNKMTVSFVNKEAALKCLSAVELAEENNYEGGFSLMAYFRPYPNGQEYDRTIMTEYYGCKWFESDLSVQQNGLHFEFSFDTPWSPPEELVDYMWQNMKELGIAQLDLYAVEQGCDFVYQWSTGETESLDELTRSTTDFDESYFDALIEYENGEMSKEQEAQFLLDYPDAHLECPWSYLDERRMEAIETHFGFWWSGHFGG